MSPVDQAGRNAVLHSAWNRSPIVFERALGSTLWDTEGRAYLDLLSSNMGPAMVGYSHPSVVAAIQRQVETLMGTRILFDNVPLVEFCGKVARVAPFDDARTYICPGGGEANEAAIKLAMQITGRDEVVSLGGAYHGQSIATMSLCGMPGLRERFSERIRMSTFRQIVPGHAYREWRDPSGMTWRESISALEADLRRSCNVAALIMEPIQGVAGHVVFEQEFLEAIRRLCDSHGVLLIADEVQTALGRCGVPWATTLFGLAPDIITVGKGVGGGMPFGAVIARGALVTDAVQEAPWHLLTAQGHPVQAAAGSAVLDVVESEGLVERSRQLGEAASRRFRGWMDRYEVIGDVRCPGLYIGIDLVMDRKTKAPATAACSAAWEFALGRGLLTGYGGVGGNVYKFKPPLTVSEHDFARMLDGTEEVLAFINQDVHGRTRKGA